MHNRPTLFDMLHRTTQKIRTIVLAGYQSALLRWSLVGSVVLWLAYPPVGWGLLAWVAPGLWIHQILPPKWNEKRPYLKLWVAGMAFWLLAVHWIRLPHPMNYLAWATLSAYLGIYLPLFVALSRVAVHRLRVPLWLAAPVVWTGLDLLRGHVMTGFLMGSLAHTQIGFPRVIQLADIFGEYGVTFLIVLVASCFVRVCYRDRTPSMLARLLQLSPAVVALAAALIYGQAKFDGHRPTSKPTGPRIALIQGNYSADWKTDSEKQDRIMREYIKISHDAVVESGSQKIDLLVWPETTFRHPLLTTAEGYMLPPDPDRQSMLNTIQEKLVQPLSVAVLVGVSRTHIFPVTAGGFDYADYNSSALVDNTGKLIGTYDKMHRVLFGEYIPLADWFPILYRLTPLTGGIQAGQSPTAMQLDGTTYAVNICYETVVPHLIRQHVLELTENDTPPDVLVNLTNDAWFWGSSELDMHLACGIFRAVETRTPLVVAANGGLSAHVDRSGLVLDVSQRQRPEALLVDVRKSPLNREPTFYVVWGDWFAGLCVLCCIVLAVVGYRDRRRSSDI